MLQLCTLPAPQQKKFVNFLHLTLFGLCEDFKKWLTHSLYLPSFSHKDLSSLTLNSPATD